MPKKRPIAQRFTRGVIKAFGLNKKVERQHEESRQRRKKERQDQKKRNEEAKARNFTPIHVYYKLKF